MAANFKLTTIRPDSSGATYDYMGGVAIVGGSDFYVGWSENTNDPNQSDYGFSWNGSTFTQFSDPSAFVGNVGQGTGGTQALAVNASGEIVGTYIDVSGHQLGFTDTNGTFVTINESPLVGGNFANTDGGTSVTGVTDSGEIVGTIISPNGAYHYEGFVKNGGTVTYIQDPKQSTTTGYGTYVTGVNAAGTEAVGYYYDASGVTHGFTYSNPNGLSSSTGGVYTDVGPAGTQILGVNNSGELVGTENGNGFVDINGNFNAPVGGNGTWFSAVTGVDNNGKIVGYTEDPITSDFTGVNTACYCRGTLIETETGPVAVENLAIGDRVKTRGGKTKPIKWMGTRAYDGRFLRGAVNVLPVCVKAGALADATPARDLWLSPNHALYLEGVLIEARDLVNGVSIVQAEAVERVDYYHIELFGHDVITAEGAEAESFIDNGSRNIFSNSAEFSALYPQQTRRAKDYAPRRDCGFELEAARQKIDARAGLVAAPQATGALAGWVEGVSSEGVWGWAMDEAAPGAPVCLHVLADGRMIGRVLANRFREDLKAAGLGAGRCAFAFEAPRGVDLAKARIELRRAGDGALLPAPARKAA